DGELSAVVPGRVLIGYMRRVDRKGVLHVGVDRPAEGALTLQHPVCGDLYLRTGGVVVVTGGEILTRLTGRQNPGTAGLTGHRRREPEPPRATQIQTRCIADQSRTRWLDESGGKGEVGMDGHGGCWCGHAEVPCGHEGLLCSGLGTPVGAPADLRPRGTGQARQRCEANTNPIACSVLVGGVACCHRRSRLHSHWRWLWRSQMCVRLRSQMCSKMRSRLRSQWCSHPRSVPEQPVGGGKGGTWQTLPDE